MFNFRHLQQDQEAPPPRTDVQPKSAAASASRAAHCLSRTYIRNFPACDQLCVWFSVVSVLQTPSYRKQEHDFAAIHGCHLGYARSASLRAANALTDTVTGVDAHCFAVGSAAEVANLSCRRNGNTGRSGRRWHGCVRASERVGDSQLMVGLVPSILSCTLYDVSFRQLFSHLVHDRDAEARLQRRGGRILVCA